MTRDDLVLDALANTCGWSIESAAITPGSQHTLVLCWPNTSEGMDRARAVLMAIGREDTPLLAPPVPQGRPVFGGTT